ncbi:hypothetical protein CK203_009347 [Vitis vinifera]|uniref:Retrotransposon gag domain-containing protein n=1 Tax=Vitis vinifera TaxID=29760 RepID=A0A438JSN3_VITVI|nr:hypothetical protein CK203_009347 [Vitis vinifera]
MLDPKDSEYAAWCQYDGLVKTWMLNSLEPEIAASVGLTSTAKKMWDDIKEMFSNDGNNSRIFSLFQQLVDNKEGERSLPEFFAAYRGIINELRELLPLSTDLDSEVSRGKPICTGALGALSCNSWLIDLGASNHMTGDQHQLNNFTPCQSL